MNILVERKTKNIKLIYDNPGESGNKLYKKARQEGYGIKKQEFYKIFRTIRKISEPTIEEKRKATPVKHRKPIKPIKGIKDIPIPTKRGAYGIVEVNLKDDDTEFWIKYETKKSLEKQLDDLKRRYKLKAIKIKFHGYGTYTTFIDQAFKELLESVGINL